MRVPPTGVPSAVTRRSSIHTSPGAGPAAASFETGAETSPHEPSPYVPHNDGSFDPGAGIPPADTFAPSTPKREGAGGNSTGVPPIVTPDGQPFDLDAAEPSAGSSGFDRRWDEAVQMLAQRHQLAAEVENLEARLKTLEVAKSTSQYCFDDSQLGRVKQLIADVKQRLEVDERLLNAEGYFQDEIQLEEETEAAENIVDQVTEYFGVEVGNGRASAEVALGK